MAVHAGVADRRIWESCTEMWVAAGHRVVTYDQRGFGDTETMVSDIIRSTISGRLWMTVSYKRRCWWATRWGVGVAIDALLAEPHRITALVVIGTAVGGAPEEEPGASIKEIVERYEAALEAEDVEEVNRIEAHFWLDGPAQAEGRVSGSPRDLFLDMNGRALELDETAGEAEWNEDAWGRLSEIEAPTLVVVGEYDAGFMIDRSRQIAAAVPGAELVTIPESAHLPPLDAPGVLATPVTEFLR